MSTPVSRADFPILDRVMRSGDTLTYLDAGATSLRPTPVLDAMRDFDMFHCGAVNRGAHQLAEEATDALESARVSVARLVGVPARELVWTMSTTDALNLLTYSLGNSLHEGPTSSIDDAAPVVQLGAGRSIVITRAEHHANFVTWQRLARATGTELRCLDLTDDGRIDLSGIERMVDASTAVVAFTHMSNVSGAITDVAPFVEAARAVGALTVLDACQSVPHIPVNLADLGVDCAAFSGHKMLGPTGIGAFWAREEILNALPPFRAGGSMVEIVRLEKTTYADPTQRFEAGTQPVTQAVGMGAAAEYLMAAGMEAIEAHERTLTDYLLAGLAEIPGVRVLGPLTTHMRGPAVAFDVDGIHPHDVSQILDSHGVAVRVGHHCAQPIHQHFGVHASTRATIGPYNTGEDVDKLLTALATVRPFFGLS